MAIPGNFVVFVYTLDVNHSIFSHQVGVVAAVASKVEHVIVMTGSVGKFKVPSNVTVIDINWTVGRPFINLYKVLSAFFREVLPKRPTAFLSHMHEWASVILSIPLWILRIPHFLWYAHTSFSLGLRLSLPFLKKVFTSTPGSCPSKSRKVKAIGQSIDMSLFPPIVRDLSTKTKAIHVGRLDRSKNLGEIFSTLFTLRVPKFELTLIGSPSNGVETKSWLELKEVWKDFFESNRIIQLGSMPRQQIKSYFEGTHFFIHAYEGSLDKAILEATASGVPVVTINDEYHKEFGGWAEESTSSRKTANLEKELLGFLNMERSALAAILETRYDLVVKRHSLDQWVIRLLTEICE